MTAGLRGELSDWGNVKNTAAALAARSRIINLIRHTPMAHRTLKDNCLNTKRTGTTRIAGTPNPTHTSRTKIWVRSRLFRRDNGNVLYRA